MTSAAPRTAKDYNPRKIRHCIICGVALEPGQDYQCMGVGPSSGACHDRIWFCDKHGPQVRAAIERITE